MGYKGIDRNSKDTKMISVERGCDESTNELVLQQFWSSSSENLHATLRPNF